MKKIIELPMLSTRTDCNALAKEVLSQCDLLHPSRQVEVEQTIYYLKKRKLHNPKGTVNIFGSNLKLTLRINLSYLLSSKLLGWQESNFGFWCEIKLNFFYTKNELHSVKYLPFCSMTFCHLSGNFMIIC